MRHKIEEAVRVYLVLDELPDGRLRWVIDDPSVDGMALFGYDSGALNEDCNCDRPAECERMREAGDQIELPDGLDLMRLLAEKLGFRIVPDHTTGPGREYDHDPKPDDMPEPGDRCRECGEPITWVGPSQYDWMHVGDRRNRQ